MYNEQLLESRHVRVFISSTFRDMHAEREELTKNIFPQLRKMCEERGVEWSEVDLRWGITDELAAEGEVLPICLSEIDHCRPFLIGILGDRYGWVPTEISPELINEYPWLKDYQGSSITEIEIVHGVLNHMESAKANSFFYFRAPVRRMKYFASWTSGIKIQMNFI